MAEFRLAEKSVLPFLSVQPKVRKNRASKTISVNQFIVLLSKTTDVAKRTRTKIYITREVYWHENHIKSLLTFQHPRTFVYETRSKLTSLAVDFYVTLKFGYILKCGNSARTRFDIVQNEVLERIAGLWSPPRCLGNDPYISILWVGDYCSRFRPRCRSRRLLMCAGRKGPCIHPPRDLHGVCLIYRRDQ